MSVEPGSRGNKTAGVRVGVCGAGVAGLTLASRLGRLGFDVTVLEARDECAIETEGLFLTLAPNGMNGLRTIDLEREVAQHGIVTTAIEILDERGRRLALMDQSDHEQAFGSLLVRNLILPVVIPLGIKAARRSYAYRVERDPLALPAA